MTIDASASSQFVSALLLAGARFDEGVDVRHVGKPVPSLPHIEMTVAMLRERGVEVDDSDANRWVVAPGPDPRPSTPPSSPTSPTPHRSSPGRRHGRHGDASRTGRAATTQAGDALRDILTADGLRGRPSTTRACTVTGAERLAGVDLDLHDVGELDPGVAALCALADSPSHLRGIAHIRGHETDRLAALATELGGLGADVDRARRRTHASARRPCTAASSTPTPTTGWPTPASSSASAVDGVLVEDIATTAKTFPDFAVGVDRRGGSVAGERRYTEQDHEHYERPRRRTRPRTKDRPVLRRRRRTVVVVTVDRGRFTLLVDGTPGDGDEVAPARAARAWSSATASAWSATPAAPTASLARIVEVGERSTMLRRTADDDDPVERVIVANADQLVVVTALADPEPRPRLIDRALVAAYDAGMAPLLVPHQGRPRRPRDTALDLPLARGAVGGHPPQGGVPATSTEVRDRLRGRTSVLVGHSGVGKSTLVNALVPDAAPRGRHRQRRHRPRPAHLHLGLPRSTLPDGDAAGSSTPPASGPSGWRTWSRST